MKWSLGFTWLAAMTERTARSFDPNDPGDMGTAFGLEASMATVDDRAPELLPARSLPLSLPWEHRLIRRSGL